jgi:hypothetical protein
MVILQNRFSSRLFAALTLTFLGAGAALATTPKINEVLTAYSTAAAPVSINILGTNLCTGSPCAAPAVTLGGKSVSLSAFIATSITAKLPQPVTLGDYTLKVVTTAGSAVFELTLSNLATQGTGAPTVKDSTGQVVGAYMFVEEYLDGGSQSDYVFIRAFSRPFAIGFSTLQLGAIPGFTLMNALWYASTDCSGTPYFNFYGASASTQVPLAGVGGTTAYVMGRTISTFTAQSKIVLTPGSANGACTAVSATDNFFPVIATYDLSILSLVPPFSVQ